MALLTTYHRALYRLAVVLSVVSAVLLVGLTSALPAVLDLRPALLGTTGVGAIAFAVGMRNAAGRIPRVHRAALALGLAITSAITLHDLSLSYRTQQLSFANGDVTLHGTLYLPVGRGRHPAVVLVHGSGRSSRHGWRFYARAYARSGVAALTYDKRGSGESSGDLDGATYQALGDDAAAGVEVLRRHPELDPANVGLHGLSEGEWTGVLAARKSHPAFLVIVSGSAMTPAAQVAYETAERVRRGGHGEAAAQRAGELYRQVSAFHRTGEGRDTLNRQLAAARLEAWFRTAWSLDTAVPEFDAVERLSWFGGWRARMDFDALPLMAGLSCPVLVQEGGSDPKMDGAGAIARMREALAAGGNTRFTGILYPNATHNIIEWRLPFRLPPPWFAPRFLADQQEWVRRQVGLEREARPGR